MVALSPCSARCRQSDHAAATLAGGSLPQASPSIARLEPTEAIAFGGCRLRFSPNFATTPTSISDSSTSSGCSATCGRFADVLTGAAQVRLHGDPHLEQYAFTTDSRGLDDFDDSAMGPFVLDVTRFLASLDLALDQRGWSAVRPRASAAFFAGYRASLSDTTYLPPDPAAVTRLRAQRPREMHEFLAWVDSLMLPLDPEYEAAVPFVRAALEGHAGRVRPGMPAGFFRVKKTGRLNLGVGSALASKVLLRLEGPSHPMTTTYRRSEAQRRPERRVVSARRSRARSRPRRHWQRANRPPASPVHHGAATLSRYGIRRARGGGCAAGSLPTAKSTSPITCPRTRSWRSRTTWALSSDTATWRRRTQAAGRVMASQQLRAAGPDRARIRQAVAEQTAELMEAWRRFRAR